MASLGFPGVKNEEKMNLDRKIDFRVVSLEIPVFRIFLVKINFIVKSIPGSPEKPREAVRTWGNQTKTTFFRLKNAHFLKTRIFDIFVHFLMFR